MDKMDDDDILSVIAAELAASAGGDENDFIESNRKAALAYYLGQENGKEVEGRSRVTSTDVADAIEWIKPQVIEQLTKNNEVVTFDPISEQDERQAELETKAVHEVYMKDNNGFEITYQSVFDALLQKNSIIKTTFEKEECVTVDRYTGLVPQAYQLLMSDDSIELIEESLNPDGTIDVKIRVTKYRPKINVCSVPPEEFRITRNHNSPDPTAARFTAHVVRKTSSDLIKSGIKKSVVDDLPTADHNDDDRDYRFYMQGESVYPNEEISIDKSQRMIEVAECYLHIDIDGDGIAEFCKIDVAGGDNPTDILRIEEMDVEDHPFSSALAIIMSHKFSGLSIYDRLHQIQDQKTTLWRNIFDNIYLQNNQRTLVVEGMVNLDDLTVSRPGGVVRQRAPGSVEPMLTPPIGDAAYEMMSYLDQVRAGRVGVTPEGQIQADNIGDRVGSEGIERLMTAKDAVVGLMTRVIAETGYKPVMIKIQNIMRKHFDVLQDIKYKDMWIQTLPQSWPQRTRTTVRVGTGSGSSLQSMSSATQIIQGQLQLVQAGRDHLVTDQNIFNAWKMFCNSSGMSNTDSFFLDPYSQQGQIAIQQKQQMMQQMQQKEEQMEQAMIQMQSKLADAEIGKAQAQLQNVQLKGQIEAVKNELEEAKTIIDDQNVSEELEFKYTELIKNLEFKVLELQHKTGIETKKIEVQKETAESNGSEES